MRIKNVILRPTSLILSETGLALAGPFLGRHTDDTVTNWRAHKSRYGVENV